MDIMAWIHWFLGCVEKACLESLAPHLDCECDLANHVARMRTDHATAQDLAVAICFWAVVKPQFGHAFISAMGNGAA